MLFHNRKYIKIKQWMHIMRNRIIPNLTLVLYLILIIIPNPTLVLYLILIKNQPSPPTVMLRTSISEKKHLLLCHSRLSYASLSWYFVIGNHYWLGLREDWTLLITKKLSSY